MRQGVHAFGGTVQTQIYTTLIGTGCIFGTFKSITAARKYQFDRHRIWALRTWSYASSVCHTHSLISYYTFQEHNSSFHLKQKTNTTFSTPRRSSPSVSSSSPSATTTTNPNSPSPLPHTPPHNQHSPAPRSSTSAAHSAHKHPLLSNPSPTLLFHIFTRPVSPSS